MRANLNHWSKLHGNTILFNKVTVSDCKKYIHSSEYEYTNIEQLKEMFA